VLGCWIAFGALASTQSDPRDQPARVPTVQVTHALTRPLFSNPDSPPTRPNLLHFPETRTPGDGFSTRRSGLGTAHRPPRSSCRHRKSSQSTWFSAADKQLQGIWLVAEADLASSVRRVRRRGGVLMMSPERSPPSSPGRAPISALYCCSSSRRTSSDAPSSTPRPIANVGPCAGARAPAPRARLPADAGARAPASQPCAASAPRSTSSGAPCYPACCF
jgi:hypothetical protein